MTTAPDATAPPAYQHRQRGWYHVGFYTIGLSVLAFAALRWDFVGQHRWILFIPVMTLSRAAAFHWLETVDRGDHLFVRYGPMPVPWFTRRLRYAEMTEVRAERTKTTDGWGLRWSRKNGWLYNIWGYGCVRVVVGGKTFRLGTDEPAALEAFLRERTGADAR